MDGSIESQLNTSYGTKQTKIMSDKDWIRKWEKKEIGFHEEKVHKLLAEFLETMLHNRKQITIFFPLCGKAVDMKWLADMGHNIVGVDVCEMGLKDFFKENNVTYLEEAVPAIPGAKVFKSTSGNISLYCCSIFDINDSIIGKCDGIWDRGAMVAVNPTDRERYASVILSLMDKDCRYLLDTFEYDPKLHPGPPFYIPDAELEKLLGSQCNVKCLKITDSLTDKQRAWGLDSFDEKIFLVTSKLS
ncbi:thiopurine S-methyltransferase [Spea bombifrons]|uniref:thiopurine S-methyltransferase n=1 Tax=Spea bombifrons TaxID=233779 RepID=UPI002349AC1B|nr:thiopurine S-methyltransferase [Spea bombifrons]